MEIGLRDTSRNLDIGVVNPLPGNDPMLASKKVDFYWIDGGDNIIVTYTVDFGGGNVGRRRYTFKVLRPTVNKSTIAETKDNPKVGVDTTLHFGTGVPGKPATSGVSWTATVTAPADGRGQLAFVQLADIDRQRQLDPSNVWEEETTNDDWFPR